jgi:hypothetical protein
VPEGSHPDGAGGRKLAATINRDMFYQTRILKLHPVEDDESYACERQKSIVLMVNHFKNVSETLKS